MLKNIKGASSFTNSLPAEPEEFYLSQYVISPQKSRDLQLRQAHKSYR